VRSADKVSLSLSFSTFAEKRISLDHVRQHPFFWMFEKAPVVEGVSVEEDESGEDAMTEEWSPSLDVMTC
jgi:hypothetical protein